MSADGHTRSTRQAWIALAALSLTLLAAMVYVLHTGARVSVEHSPLVRASSRVKLDVTLAHLWFEEILSGDRHESMADVWDLLASARSHARAMVEGGEDAEGTIAPLHDARLREKIRQVEGKLVEFERITEERRSARASAGSGTEIDQQYDAVFHELISLADEVERELYRIIVQDIRSVRRAQIFVIAGGVLLSVLVGIFFARFVGERARRERVLELKVRAEAEAREHRDRLAHVARVSTMSELAAEIAHEINQPLAAISAAAAACRRLAASDRNRSAEIRDALQLIESESGRASGVLRRLRSFVSKGESRYAPVDVNDLVREVVRRAEFDPHMRRATVRLDLAGDLPRAEADAVQIQQVLLNLMRNGVEAMNGCSAADDGISVRTCAGENREIEVSVADRGPGLPAAAAGDPFRAFFTTKESGMGMGLSISQSIVTAHGGRIWFRRDERDSETTFAFTLPAADAERA